MAITISEFEKRLVDGRLVASRRDAKRVSTFIKSNLQGRSVESFAALIPKLMNEGLSPSTSAATTTMVMAIEWIVSN